MDNKGSKSRAIVIIFVVVLLIILGLLGLTQTSWFDTSGGYLKNTSNNRSINKYTEKCEYVGYAGVIHNTDEYKSKDIKYLGKITDYKEDTFGNQSYLVRIEIPSSDYDKLDLEKYEHTNNKNIIMHMFVLI